MREWQVQTTALEGEDGRLRRLHAQRVEFPGFAETGVRGQPVPLEGGEVTLDVDLVLLAIGFTGVETDDPIYEEAGVALTPRTTVAVDARVRDGRRRRVGLR